MPIRCSAVCVHRGPAGRTRSPRRSTVQRPRLCDIEVVVSQCITRGVDDSVDRIVVNLEAHRTHPLPARVGGTAQAGRFTVVTGESGETFEELGNASTASTSAATLSASWTSRSACSGSCCAMAIRARVASASGSSWNHHRQRGSARRHQQSRPCRTCSAKGRHRCSTRQSHPPTRCPAWWPPPYRSLRRPPMPRPDRRTLRNPRPTPR
jgi:hypothetical protein